MAGIAGLKDACREMMKQEYGADNGGEWGVFSLRSPMNPEIAAVFQKDEDLGECGCVRCYRQLRRGYCWKAEMSEFSPPRLTEYRRRVGKEKPGQKIWGFMTTCRGERFC